VSLKNDLTKAMIDGYNRAGKEVGYWGTRFLQAVRRKGGLATARQMLLPRTAGQRTGLDALLDAGRPDLTVEAIVLRPRFRRLFSAEELAEAARRLGDYGREANRRIRRRERLYPDELEPGRKYLEGARKQVRVNAYERDSRARAACLEHYCYRCSVCELSFEDCYGKVGEGFIHVHHLNPFSLVVGPYELDPVRDL